MRRSIRPTFGERFAKLFSEARGFRGISGLLAGHYITRLAHYYIILIKQVVASLTFVGEMGLIDVNQLKGIKVIVKREVLGKDTLIWNTHFFE